MGHGQSGVETSQEEVELEEREVSDSVVTCMGQKACQRGGGEEAVRVVAPTDVDLSIHLSVHALR